MFTLGRRLWREMMGMDERMSRAMITLPGTTLAALAISSGSMATPPDESAVRSAPSWSASVQAPVVRELTFENAGARLAGTLFLPPARAASPVVVVYHSASNPLRSAGLYRHLTEMLPALGIGVFVYDRRGSGASSGPGPDGSFEKLADDGIAARRMLERVGGVDRTQIGYWGLSQGGWLAVLAAQRDPNCAFAISISAPMVTADVQMRFAVANILRIRGYDQAAIDLAVDARLAVDDFMLGRTSRADAQRRLDRAAAQPWFDQIYMSHTFSDPSASPWAREMRNDPLAVLRTVQKPILLIYGSTDPWIPVADSITRLEDLLAGASALNLHVIGGADHAMMNSAAPRDQVNPASFGRQSPEDPEYFAIMSGWLTSLGLSSL